MFSDYLGALKWRHRVKLARCPAGFLLLAGLLLANREDNQAGGSGHQQDAEDAVAPHAVVAGVNQVTVVRRYGA